MHSYPTRRTYSSQLLTDDMLGQRNIVEHIEICNFLTLAWHETFHTSLPFTAHFLGCWVDSFSIAPAL